MKCEYCGHQNIKDAEKCQTCGAPIEEKKEYQRKSQPFFYNGYICYYLSNLAEGIIEVQFWLGKQLIERIAVSEELLEDRVPEYCDSMPFFWDLFLLAHGEKEVIEWQEKNNKLPAAFQVRRIENPEKERLRNLSLYNLAQEARR